MAKKETGSSKPRIEKLGVKPGHRVGILGFEDPDFVVELVEAGTEVVETKTPGLFDHLFVYMDSEEHTFAFGLLRSRLRSNGAIWALWPKGRKEFNGNHVRERGLASGIVDVKVVSFSDTLSALKFVIRLEDR